MFGWKHYIWSYASDVLLNLFIRNTSDILLILLIRNTSISYNSSKFRHIHSSIVSSVYVINLLNSLSYL